MGDRANVRFKQENDDIIYFYTHWRGTELWDIVREALEYGQSRWNDESYLARIIFSHMIQNNSMGTDGFGISTYRCDHNWPDIEVDVKQQRVNIEEQSFSFKEYFLLERDPRRG